MNHYISDLMSMDQRSVLYNSINTCTPIVKEGGDKNMKRELNKTTIKKNTLGDTRTAERTPTYKEFREANECHISDVRSVMREIATKIISAGNTHDWTKLDYSGEFYRDFCLTKKADPGQFIFTYAPWYQGHIKHERHHLNDHCPEDVDLIDVIEMIADCVCAGKARRVSVYPIDIDTDILVKAVKNTQKLIEDSIIIQEDEEESDNYVSAEDFTGAL